MSRYNRENPFMYLYEQKHDELENKSTVAVKSMIIMLILAVLSLIGCITSCILYNQFYGIELIIMSGIGIYIFTETLRAVSIVNKKSQELNTMLFSDKYANINLNNEKLLSDINFYNECIGKVIFMINSIHVYNIIYSVFIAYYLIKIIAIVFIGG